MIFHREHSYPERIPIWTKLRKKTWKEVVPIYNNGHIIFISGYG